MTDPVKFYTARSGRPTGLILMDLDNFRDINNNFGHPAGDRILCELTEILKELIRPRDYFSGFGGEEFGLILHETDKNTSREMAERIRLAVEETPRIASHCSDEALDGRRDEHADLDKMKM